MSVSHQGSIDKRGSLVGMNAVARTAIAKIRSALLARYTASLIGAPDQEASARYLDCLSDHWGKKKFHVSVLLRLDREFKLIQTYCSS